MGTITFLLAALIVQAPPPPPSPDATQWERVGEDDIAAVWIDPARLSRQGDRANSVLRMDMKGELSDGLRVLISHGEIDCRARMRTVYRMEGYRRDGSLIAVREIPAARREPYQIGTGPLDNAVFDRVCGAR